MRQVLHFAPCQRGLAHLAWPGDDLHKKRRGPPRRLATIVAQGWTNGRCFEILIKRRSFAQYLDRIAMPARGALGRGPLQGGHGVGGEFEGQGRLRGEGVAGDDDFLRIFVVVV